MAESGMNERSDMCSGNIAAINYGHNGGIRNRRKKRYERASSSCMNDGVYALYASVTVMQCTNNGHASTACINQGHA